MQVVESVAMTTRSIDTIMATVFMDQSPEEQLKELEEAIGVAEKRLLGASKNLAYICEIDKDTEVETEEEWTACDRSLHAFGDILDELDDTSKTHQTQVASLRKQLTRVTSDHSKARQRLTNLLLGLKMSMLSKKEQKDEEKLKELERGTLRQEALEQTVLKLRTLQLLSSEPQQQHEAPAAQELALRERHEEVTQQVAHLRHLLVRQQTERTRDVTYRKQTATRRRQLEQQLRTLVSDRDMARLEFTGVCRDYREEQQFYRSLQERLENARTSRLLSSLVPQHSHVIWQVVTLDSAAKQASEQCATLHRALVRSDRLP